MASSPSSPEPSKPRAADYARLRQLFDECVDLPEGARLAWIEGQVPDETLRIELVQMLASDAGGTDLFGVDPLQKLGDYFEAGHSILPDLVGSRCGAFRLVRLLGSGGQGAVYLGERDDADFNQTVAVKLLREVILDADDLRRFRRERDILARFEHPGVARLIDAGVSEKGLPFLAMEYVDGEPIDRWCTQRRAERATRMRLFAELCDVVAAAHRQLIVHRDLKPSNVLVSNEGRIKVLDFGIARLLDEEGGARTGTMMLTPGYGAPEQRTGEPVTPASDVFALGAMLRELITQQTPPRRSSETWPAWPAIEPDELRWIFERCCAADASERYRDAAELGEDIARFRDRKPVRAHPPSRWYRARKFVARHRGGVSISALLLLTTLFGIGATVWQAHLARQQSARATLEAGRALDATARAEAVRDFVIEVFEAGGAGLPRDQMPDTATLLERGRVAALDDDSRSPQARAEMSFVLGRIFLALQREDRALELDEKALQLLAAQSPRDEPVYAQVLAHRAELLGRLGRGADADADFDAALAIQQRLDPGGLDTARTLMARGERRASAGRIEPALVDLEQALQIQLAHPDATARSRASAHSTYGVALWRAGDCARAEPLLRQAVALSREGYGAQHAETSGALSNLSLCLTQMMKLDESEAVSRESLAIASAAFGENHPALGQARNNLANLLLRIGKLGEAEILLRAKLDVDRQTGLDQAGSGLNSWINLGNLLRARGDLAGAQSVAENALQIGQRTARDAPVGREPELMLARIALSKGDLDAAQTHVDSYRAWLATPEGRFAAAPVRVDIVEAQIALERGDFDKADRLLTPALRQLDGLTCSDSLRGYAAAADLRLAQQRDDESRALLGSAVEACEKASTPLHFAYGEALLRRAELQWRRGPSAQAVDDMRRAAPAFAELPDDHPFRTRLAALEARL